MKSAMGVGLARPIWRESGRRRVRVGAERDSVWFCEGEGGVGGGVFGEEEDEGDAGFGEGGEVGGGGKDGRVGVEGRDGIGVSQGEGAGGRGGGGGGEEDGFAGKAEGGEGGVDLGELGVFGVFGEGDVDDVVAALEKGGIELGVEGQIVEVPGDRVGGGGAPGADDGDGGAGGEGEIELAEAEVVGDLGGDVFSGEVFFEVEGGVVLEGQDGGDDFGDVGAGFRVGVHLVGEEGLLAEEGGIDVDDFEAFVEGGLADEGDDLVADDFIGDVPLVGEGGRGGVDDEARFGGEVAEGGDEFLVVGEEVVLVDPILGFGVVAAELEDDDVGVEGEGVFVGGGIEVGEVGFFEDGHGVDAEVADVVGVAEEFLELTGVGLGAVANAVAEGDGIADAGDADFFGGAGGEGAEEGGEEGQEDQGGREVVHGGLAFGKDEGQKTRDERRETKDERRATGDERRETREGLFCWGGEGVGDFFGVGDFAADHFAAGAGEFEVVVAAQAFVGDEVFADGDLVGDFIDGGAFVDFVEHADEDGFDVEGSEGGEFFPEELAFEAGDVGAARGPVMHVVPGEAGEGVGHVAFGELAEFGDVGAPGVFLHAVDASEVVVAAGVPDGDGVEHAVDVVPGVVFAGALGEGAPAGVDAADEVDAAVDGVFLEEVDEVCGLRGGEGVAVVVEAEAPEEDDGLALVVEVAGILADFDLVAEELPVVLDSVNVGFAHGEVEHHGPDAAFAVGAFADVGEDHVDMAGAGAAGGFADEAAEEDAIDAVLAHPLEVDEGGAFAEAAVEACGGAVGHLDAGDVGEVFGVVLGDVGPHVNAEAAGAFFEAGAPMAEAEGRAVAGGVEPALVAAEDFAVQRGGIDVGARGTRVRLQPGLVVGLGGCLRGGHAAGQHGENCPERDEGAGSAEPPRHGFPSDFRHRSASAFRRAKASFRPAADRASVAGAVKPRPKASLC